MAKQRVQIFQAARGVEVETNATIGAVVGFNLVLADGTVVTESMLGIGENPGDDFPNTYWRLILEIPPNVVALAETTTTGLYAITGPGTSATREIQPTVGRTTVSNGDGVAGDPTIDLAVLLDSGVGAGLVKITRDAYGRVEGTESATTDDLTEGASNLYFTDERAQDAVVAATIVDGDADHSPSCDAVFDAMAGKEVAGAAAAALAAANDFTVDEVAALNAAGSTYAPTVTAVSNAGSSTAPADWIYARVGDTVTVGGQVNVIPLALGSFVVAEVSLPVPSNFTAFSDAAGAGSAANGTSLGPVGVNGSSANDTLRVVFAPFATTTHNIFVQAIYRIKL